MNKQTIDEAFRILKTLRIRFETEIKENPNKSFPGKAYLDEIKKVIEDPEKEKERFDIDNIFMYSVSGSDRTARTRKRLQELADLGMEFFNGEFFIEGIVSGCYIEGVWDMQDEEWLGYVRWLKEVIKEKTPK